MSNTQRGRAARQRNSASAATHQAQHSQADHSVWLG